MKTGRSPATALFGTRASGETMQRLNGDERGFFLPGILLPLLFFFVIFGWGASIINMTFLLSLMVLVIFALAVYGAITGKIKWKHTMYIGGAAMAITFIMTVNIVVVFGVILGAFTLWKLTPYKMPALWIGSLGLALLLIIWGTMYLQSMGIMP